MMGFKARKATKAETARADAWVAAHVAAGAREIVGDELIASTAARVTADRIEQENPFPHISDDESPEDYVARWRAWRERAAGIEREWREKARRARAAVSALDELIGSDDLLPGMHATMDRARMDAGIYESYAVAAMMFTCRKSLAQADNALHAAIFQLYCKGVAKSRIAKLLDMDRAEVRRRLKGSEAIRETMRAYMGLRDPMGE